jgi:phosphoribosylformimino-5-aminoimidazole carboxamide ribotide isomerase
MIVPCIDLQDGKAVQLVRGRRRELALANVLGLLERFGGYPSIHVIDLDAAMGRGRNSRIVRSICQRAAMRVRVGGGIRTVARAETILRWGAEKVIVGSAALRHGDVNHDFLRSLSAKIARRRVIIALDARGGRIVVHGWRKRLRLRPEDVMPRLEQYCSEFLCTYVDNEGTMRGTSLEWFRLLRRATKLPITAAGGIRSRRQVDALSRLRMNAAIGMALYRDRLR